MTAFDLCVVICTRNRREKLEKALTSLAQQTSSHTWEVLVVDNGSTDDTPSFLRSLPDRYPVPLRTVLEPESGISPCRNHGIREARSRLRPLISQRHTQELYHKLQKLLQNKHF